MNNHSDSAKIQKARTTGLFFLLAFLAYGLGRHLFKSEGGPEKYLGAALIFSNSIMVLFIGLFLRETLKQSNVWVGNIYLMARVFEALALASILLNLMPSLNIPDDAGYFPAMLVLGLGSIPMCLELYKQKISPAWLALGGLIGYTIFSFGFLMEFLGKKWSMYLLAPGGAWEITFAVWLMIKNGPNKIHDPSPAKAG
ncbi:MAG TPA: DUF4386 domain-containing protein [Saprospiraceae bacterium]|nr:DUF4386 domain-containing protein [Saprospiraceae bacterium]HNT21577.1 DUF4386 domain-containing protein [Saprospiraceae bacterium]